MTPARRVGLVLGAAGFLLAVPALALAQEASVSAVDNEFNPAQLDVEEGTTVTWTNEGQNPHTVTASDGSFDSGNLNPGDSFSQTFDDAGEFEYFCEYHGAAGGEGMAGAVSVSAAEGDPTDDTDDPTDDGTGDPTADDEPLPQTGSDISAFVYLGAVLIAAGAVCLRLERSAP